MLKTPPSSNQNLVDQAIEAIASRGLEEMSLRSVSAAAGVTTAAIVHHFGNKAGLLAAAIERALNDERAYHAHWVSMRGQGPLGYLGFVDWAALYIEDRATQPTARFWLELLYKARQVDDAAAVLSAWHQMRVKHWQDLLALEGLDSSKAHFLAAYCCMEEVCAHSLHGLPPYRLLLRETLRALLAGLFGQPSDPRHNAAISEWLNARPTHFPDDVQHDAEGVPDRLLNLAAQEILARGLESITQRRLAALAEVSSSMIVYHFGSMNAFITQATWRAMMQTIPSTLDPAADPSRTNTFEKWVRAEGAMIVPGGIEQDAGFYCDFARITGQIALQSLRKPELLPLIERLRIADGTGSHRASQTIWRGAVKMNRGQASAFAVWIKGQAVLNQAGVPAATAPQSLVRVAAEQLLQFA